MQASGSYVICGTPRSGSTLLCDLLAATGVAGRPASYFRSESMPRWRERLGIPAAEQYVNDGIDRPYLEAVIREGRGNTGTFGCRLMWESLAELSSALDHLFPGRMNDRARLEAAFGSLLFIHLSRADKVSQAVSRVKAMQTGLWHVSSDGAERERTTPSQNPIYDRDRIGKYVEDLAAQDKAWECWFAYNEIIPLRIHYETLSIEPRGALETILSVLGKNPSSAASIEPRTKKMGDIESQTWAARFRAESGKSLP